MNLLYTITAYPPSTGGAQAHFHQLARRLIRHHRLQVAAHWDRTRTDWLFGTTLTAPGRSLPYVLDGVPVHLLSLAAGQRMHLAPWVLGYYLAKGPAIAHISDSLVPHLAPLARNADLIHNGRVGREGLGFASLKLARQLGVPFVLTPFHHPRWVGWNYRHYLQLYREADGLIALTMAEKETLVSLGVRSERVFVTGMGPILAEAPDADAFRRRYSLDGQIVLFLGQKYRYKGLATLLQAATLVWPTFPETCFVFVGPRTRYSRSLFKHPQDRRILELGIVDLQTKTDALAACDLLCLPSTQESFGAVLPEAWMLGKPVIGSDVPAIREVISDGIDGYVVPQDPAIIAERILDLLSHPPIAAEMGRRGQDKARSRYTWDRLAQQTEEAYRTILG
jgi:glycosyltransferase involved in cell wall biosynthesis